MNKLRIRILRTNLQWRNSTKTPRVWWVNINNYNLSNLFIENTFII